MDTIEVFGFKWNNESQNHGGLNINILTNEQIGKVIFTMNCLQTRNYDNEWKEEDNYKLLSLIHEKNVQGKPYFIYKKEDYQKIEKSDLELDNYTLAENKNMLRDFPKNIIELQERSLFMLYMQYPKYGDKIKNLRPSDFFSNNNDDWIFILKAMKCKEWIDIEFKMFGDGSFGLTKPFLIAEKGWLEIEENLGRNYSKQVFVAMRFDESLENASKMIEKAIKDCGLKPMQINRKEHNNEISGEILLEIVNSRIVIADVTGQRNGVYFEAGFALGHNKSVIWSCKKSDLENVHFDTRQYNHIVWENEDDLYVRLRDRIKATLAIENI